MKGPIGVLKSMLDASGGENLFARLYTNAEGGGVVELDPSVSTWYEPKPVELVEDPDTGELALVENTAVWEVHGVGRKRERIVACGISDVEGRCAIRFFEWPLVLIEGSKLSLGVLFPVLGAQAVEPLGVGAGDEAEIDDDTVQAEQD